MVRGSDPADRGLPPAADTAGPRPVARLLRGARVAGRAGLLDLRWRDGAVAALADAGALAPASDDVVLDLAGAHLVPGLIDAHVHLSRGAAVVPGAADVPGVALAPKNARATLAAGVTAVRDLGARGGTPSPLVTDSDRGERVMPRVVPAGEALTRVGCYGGFLGTSVVDGAELEAQAWAQIEAGAQALKVILTGPVDFATGSVARPHFDEPDLDRVVAVARRVGVPLAVHANGHEGVSLALRAGVDSLEHGILLGEEDLRMMAAGGTVWVPTLTPLFNLCGDPRWPGLGALLEGHLAAVARGVEIGATVVAGSDAGGPGVPHPSLFTELALLRRAGLSSDDLGRATGSTAAALLGLAGGYGRLEEGARTDLVWFSRDPYAGEPGPPCGMLLA